MADETTVDETTTTTTTETGASTTETGKDGQAFDAARAQRLIDQQRDEIKALKATSKELDTAKARLKEIDDASKSETERLASKASEAEEKLSAAEARVQDLAIRLAVERAAGKAGFIDVDDAYQLLDRKAIELEDGEPKNVDALLTALAKAKPHLVKAGEGDPKKTADRGTPTTPRANGRAAPNDKTQADIDSLRATGRYSV